jgi:hypothetical protein
MYHGILNIIGVSRKAVSRDFAMHSDSWEGERLCGRYQIDEKTAKEIEKIIRLTDGNV